MRGEQVANTIAIVIELGSPPLARGTGTLGKSFFVNHRITPACAGNSPLPSRIVSRERDHPRLRGEQTFHAYIVLSFMGSPPLARGTERRLYR